MRSHRTAFLYASLLLGISAGCATNPGGRVGGAVWHQSANLLQNPGASSATVTPPWTPNGGMWTVTSGPATLCGGLSINSSDGSPWFLATGPSALVNCFFCSQQMSSKLSQTVSFPVGFFHTYTTAITYGGDAFAGGCLTGNGISGYFRSAGYQAIFSLDFYDSLGHPLGTDISPDIFNSTFACVLPSTPKHSYGYRRTVGGIPQNTRSIRFTATMIDVVTVCNNLSTMGTFKNGFDNMWMNVAYEGPPSAGFVASPAPNPSANVTPQPGPAAPPG